jgi:catechol 2,3-dioxygenase-like lactoylglutathione lyase family enzyme
MITGLHHLVFAAADFESALDEATKLFARAPLGVDVKDGVKNAWFALSNVAICVSAPQGEGEAPDRLRGWLENNGAGLCEIVFATADVEKAARLLQRRALTAQAATIATGPGAASPGLRIAQKETNGVPLTLAAGAPLRGDGPIISALDHIVLRTPAPERALALYGARLGLDLRLDRSNPAWGARLIFFRCGDSIVEIAHPMKDGVSAAPDVFGGVSWRTEHIEDAHSYYSAQGRSVSEQRIGRRDGTHVFTLRNGNLGAPTIFLGGTPRRFD